MKEFSLEIYKTINNGLGEDIYNIHIQQGPITRIYKDLTQIHKKAIKIKNGKKKDP